MASANNFNICNFSPHQATTMKIFFLITIGLLTVASSFVLKHATTRNGIQKPSLIPRNMDAAAIQDIETARTAFVLCFFGAVGSAAVGREGKFYFE